MLGISYSIYKLLTGQGGSGLEDFFDGLGYTSLILFSVSLIIIVINIRRLKKHFDTFLFLLLGLPMTIIAVGGIVRNFRYNRNHDLVFTHQ